MSPFKVKFNLEDYKDILPPIPTDYSEIINSEIDDIYEQYWRLPEFPSIITYDFIYREVHRIKHGVWMLNKGVLMWLPPNYYQFLVYGNANGDPPQFRIKRLKNIYLKIRVRKNPAFMGTYTIKNRQDGETTIAMADSLWEPNSGELNNGMIGIQSKTRDDAKLPCWFNLKMQWNGYPKFIKDELYPHFTSGNNIEEKLEFFEPPDPNNPKDKGKLIIIKYGPSTHNAFDGKNNVRKMVMDEINKWLECSFYLTFTNYMKFMMPGKTRKGLFDIFSSPADTNGRHNDEAYQFWKDSDPDEIQSTGATKSRILRIYSNPLEGIEGYYDKYGDADPEEIYEHIIGERGNKPKEQQMAEIRGFPLPIKGTDKPDEDEIFGATDSHHIWINISGLKNRKLELSKVKATKVVYGNYEWPNNIPDSGIPEWRTADRRNYDEYDARFCINDNQSPKIELSDLRDPPKYVEECLGVDPFNLRYKTKNVVTGSLGAAISWRFRDILKLGKVDYPTLAYLSRPQHDKIFYEDMIKSAVARRAMVQYENTNDKMENYFEDRHYIDWMIDSIGAKPVELPTGEFKVRKGDAPSGKGATAFMNEGINLINGHTNKPLNPNDIAPLDLFDFEEVIDDIIGFNRSDTQQNHFTMALIQALLGKTKLMFRRQKKKESVNDRMVKYLLDF